MTKRKYKLFVVVPSERNVSANTFSVGFKSLNGATGSYIEIPIELLSDLKEQMIALKAMDLVFKK